MVLSVPGSILTDWRDAPGIAAVLTNLMPGEQVGHEAPIREPSTKNLIGIYAVMVHGPLNNRTSKINFSLS